MTHLSPFLNWRRFPLQFSIFTLGAILLFGGSVSAQQSAEQYTDVQAGVWYEEAADALLKDGALDAAETRLRPNDLATRAEMAKLLVLLNDRQLYSPVNPNFNDVPRTASFYAYMETAAQAGWFRGDGNCYGQNLSRCMGRPSSPVSRAEMAIILQRAFSLSYTRSAPIFPDNTQNWQWYYIPVQTAADHCILQGDGLTGRVRPASSMNRAEMIVMLYRASLNLQYSNDCSTQTEANGNITAVRPMTSRGVEVTFNVNLDANRMAATSAYTVEIVGGGTIGVNSVTVINAKTVQLGLSSALNTDDSYRIRTINMRTAGGTIFSSSKSFVYVAQQAAPAIETVTMSNASTVRVLFTERMDAGIVDDASRYRVTRENNGEGIQVINAVIVNNSTVDLELQAALSSQISYLLNTNNVRTEDGESFSDSKAFVSPTITATKLESISPIANTKIQLHFSHDLNKLNAEQEFRYRVTGFNGDMDIGLATLIDAKTVELTLDENLQSQEVYIVVATDLTTIDKIKFSDQATFTYAPSGGNRLFKASLNGTSEIPSVGTTATGTGTFTLTASGLSYDLTLKGLSGSVITGAHFHSGNVGVEGPAIETISFGGTLHTTGTWADLTSEERANLLQGDIYVNVHTAAYPDGVIRGQLVLQP